MKKPDDIIEQKRMVLNLLVDSESFWPRLKDDVASAQKNIYIQTLSFEGDKVGKQLSDLIMQSHASDKRIIIDYYTRYILSDKFLYSPKNWFDADLKREARATAEMIAGLTSNGTKTKFVNPVGFLFARLPTRNHKKIIVIDDRVSYIGGINFSDHNFAWHDLMLRIESREAADFLREDFLASWEGKYSGRRRQFDGIELFALGGTDNGMAFKPIMDLIDGAESSIYIQSPYLSHPFTDRMREAAGRGVRVTVVTPEKNNKKPLIGYIRWEAARSGFDLRLYSGRMTHLKAMLIDEKYLIVGSSNFDYFSYNFHQELVAVITDRTIVGEFIEKIVQGDDKCCIKDLKLRKTPTGYLRNFEVKTISRFVKLFNGR